MDTRKHMPRGWWDNKEHCRAAAAECKTNSEFNKRYDSAYRASRKFGWFEEITSHFEHPRKRWTIEEAKKEAEKYDDVASFAKYSYTAYEYCQHKGWLKEVTVNLKRQRRANGHWTKEQCLKELASCSTIKQAYDKYSGAVDAAKNFGWWEDIKAQLNLTRGCVPVGWWEDKEHCREAALKCSTTKEFHKKYPLAYDSSRRNGWIKDINTHFCFAPHEEQYWTYEKCKECANKCRTESGLKCRYKNAWNAIARNGWTELIPEGKYGTYWNTKEHCQEEALKYTKRWHFEKGSHTAYRAALNNGWLDEICAHMENISHREVWTYEKCKETFLQCKQPSEFIEKHQTAYRYAKKEGWYDEFVQMIETKQVRPFYWRSKEHCAEAAKQCKTRKEFWTRFGPAAMQASKQGWLDEICSHMPKLRGKWGRWKDKEECREEALKYNNRKEFQAKSAGAYDSAMNNGWLDEICSHMKILGDAYKRCVYVWEFADKYAYIGLTSDIDRRSTQHFTEENSPVRKHFLETGLMPIMRLIQDYTDAGNAQKIEGEYIIKYQTDGWNILNSAKAGSLGGIPRIWTTIDSVMAVAKQCKSINEFERDYAGAYDAAIRNGWQEVFDYLGSSVQTIRDKQ